jgi:RNA polymerase sigma-70 factor (ECF subfamily)
VFIAPRVNPAHLLSVLVDMTDLLRTALPQQTPAAALSRQPLCCATHPVSGDDAFRSLYREHSSALLAYAMHHTHDRMAAEDALQETFLRAWRHLPQLLADERPTRPWLRKVLSRILIDAARARRRRTSRLVEDAVLDGTTEGGFDAVLDREILAGAMEVLSPHHREVLEGTYFRDLPAAQLAAGLGVPVGTVRSRLHYALDTLRAELLRRAAVPALAQTAGR